MSERTCARCGLTPSEVEFRKDKRRKSDGLGAYCKPCERAYNREYYERNKAKLNARSTTNYLANRDAYLAQQRIYRQANIDRIRAYDRARCRGNLVRIERSRQWRADNTDRFRALLRAWYQANKDRAHHHSTLRMRMLGSGAKIVRINRRKVWERDRGICGICKNPVPFDVMQIDHVIPLARGGHHTYSNVQPSHETCNRRKWAKILT